MRRGAGVTVWILGILAAPLLVSAQPARLPRIGFLATFPSPRVDAFWQGLRALGYSEGRNVLVERRFSEERLDRLPDLAAELVRLKVDVIVAPDPPSASAAKRATGTIPIVMRSSSDPVETGLVASIARPGGNITGVYSIAEELIGKRLELLKELVPRLSRVAVLWDPDFPGSRHWFQEAGVAAGKLGVQVQSLEARGPDPNYERVFAAATRQRAGALITLRNPAIVRHHRRIANLAVRSRLPTIFDDREFTEAGGLMSYGANLADLYRRVAYFVDRILKGTSPADLPVEQPTRFELVINGRTAKALGLTIPQSIQLRTDQVIE